MRQRVGPEAAVGVDDRDNHGRILGQMPEAVIERVALADACRLVANDDLRACVRRDLRRVVRAIVGDHEQAVPGAQLGLDVEQGIAHAHAFVVRGNKNGELPVDARDRRRVGGVAARKKRRHDLKEQRKGRNGGKGGDQDRDEREQNHGRSVARMLGVGCRRTHPLRAHPRTFDPRFPIKLVRA